MKDHRVSRGLFMLLFCLLTIVMVIIWEVSFHEEVYYCNDSRPFGYLTPGSWVDGDVVYLEKMRDGRWRSCG